MLPYRLAASPNLHPAHLIIQMLDLTVFTVRVKLTALHILFGGVTASTEVIAAKRHTGVHASVIVCKNRIANQQLAYAA